MNKISVAVVGASGYAGGELIRLLLSHPSVQLTDVVSETYAGQPLSAAFDGLQFNNLRFNKFDAQKIVDNCELVFFAQDHGVAIKHARFFLDAGLKLIDLSADFRLKDPALFHEWYKQEHSAIDLLKEAIYGLPELNREKIKVSRLIANPGCYPTASALALLPLIKSGLIELDSIIIDAKSGVSGAGRSKHNLDLHFPELNQNLRVYGIAGSHRHTPEIEQTLSFVAEKAVRVSFTPHLIPISRGLYASCYADLTKMLSTEECHRLFTEFYEAEPFVKVLPQGQMPNIKACLGTNLCFLGLGVDSRTQRVSVFSAIDNLGKGAAAQAVHNMNLVLGLDELLGLNMSGIWP